LCYCAGEPGDITDAESEFGSSEYAKKILGAVWGYPPELDLEKEAALQKGLIAMIQNGLVESAHDCSSGGLAVTLAESAFPKGIGLRVDVTSNGLPAEFVLFGEDASRVVLACDPATVAGIKQIAAKHGLAVDVLGETVLGRVEIKVEGKVAISASVGELSEAYESALERALRTEPEVVAV
jgi:phosphoribosylformylglycinamidine synthase